jgi:5-methyltetrahydropteroyltriglutamate--homocysteine methyltransferase
VFHPASVCHGPIDDSIDLGLVEEFNMVSSFARKPVKVTMTGPHLLAAVAYNEYYQDIGRIMADLGKLIHQNLKRLAAAGCKHIQIDEPYFTPVNDEEVKTAVDVINLMIEGLPDDVHVLVHVCQGNYAVGADYDGQIGHRYFDVGRHKADLICQIDCDAYLIEHDMTRHYEGLLGDKRLGVGRSMFRLPMSKQVSKLLIASELIDGWPRSRP